MMNLIKVVEPFALLASCFLLGAATADQPVPARAIHDLHDALAEPGLFHQEFENPAVTVVRIHIPPHAIVPEHDVSARVVVWLTDAHLRLTFPDGTVREERHHVGQTSWVTPERHTGENLEAQPIEFVAIISKPAAATREPR